ncbi:hypothetical protein J3459_002516 [Metarhizium acridum]|uniref:uncharacterized protein n=1 Tax=Metarhizium acridum TaxID=92637 RepID=UPI001C6BD276|nr:hypothetical protein J3458_001139 [Metarhizium acridum]KAG8428717.1 hypothetical protein J3459_002516 [Metarhizium acridum]
MKNSIIISLAALGSLAAASEEPCLSLTTKFPSCVLSCAREAASKAGCTNTADLECQCNPESYTAIQSLAFGCAATCSASDIPAGLRAGVSLCACVASHEATATATSESGTETSGTETETSGTPRTGALTSEITGTRTSTGTKTGTASEETTTTGTETETSTTTEETTTEATTTGATATTATTATTPTTATPTTTTAGAGILQVSVAVVAGAILVAAVAL